MISKKCHYALKAVLSLSRGAGGGPMTIHQIATSEGIPERFLESILRDLKQAGLTESIRGKDGGYRLTHSPEEVTPGDVILAVDGPWLQEEAADDGDVFTPLWRDADASLFSVLSGKSFQTLVLEQESLRNSNVINYSI